MTDISSLATEMSLAASSFLDGLSAEQRDKINMPFDDETRRLWYYTPTPRRGLPLLEMHPKQQQDVRRLMSIGLSEAGYNYASSVMSLENLVDRDSEFPFRTYGDLPGTVVRDVNNYCVAIYGMPGADNAWSWRIGGHHLNLHYTLRDGFVSPTPAFFGAEPARVPMPGGLTYRALAARALAAEEDLARSLLGSLSPEQCAKAVLSPIAPTDIVQMMRPKIEDGALYQIGGGGPGGQGLRDKLGLTPEIDELLRYSLKPKGLPATSMNSDQREALARIVGVYFEHLAEPIASQFAPLLEPERLESASFAWAGSSEYAQPHYYRIQGDRLLIEHDCSQNDANHTHSVWRDPEGDFGEDILAGHYAVSHQR